MNNTELFLLHHVRLTKSLFVGVVNDQTVDNKNRPGEYAGKPRIRDQLSKSRHAQLPRRHSTRTLQGFSTDGDYTNGENHLPNLLKPANEMIADHFTVIGLTFDW